MLVLQFNRLTKTLLVAPTSALLLVALALFTVVPDDQVRQWTSHLLITFSAACFFSFAGVASAVNTMKVYPSTKTVRNSLLAWYGAVPFLIIGASLVSGFVAMAMTLATST